MTWPKRAGLSSSSFFPPSLSPNLSPSFSPFFFKRAESILYLPRLSFPRLHLKTQFAFTPHEHALSLSYKHTLTHTHTQLGKLCLPSVLKQLRKSLRQKSKSFHTVLKWLSSYFFLFLLLSARAKKSRGKNKTKQKSEGEADKNNNVFFVCVMAAYLSQVATWRLYMPLLRCFLISK